MAKVQSELPIDQCVELTTEFIFGDCLPYFHLRWQPLVAADRHVLESIEESLRNPQQSTAILHSCEFFTDIMLQDFPAEVFLQRPTIVSVSIVDIFH